MEKDHPGETRFHICKSKIPVLKNIPPSRNEIILVCHLKWLFLWKKLFKPDLI